jgi:transposase
MTTNRCVATACGGWNDCTPPMVVRAEIVRELQRLELVLRTIKTIEAERDAIASAKAKMEHSNAKKIQGLVKIKCIGPEFAAALVSEVFYRSFDNRKQLAGYVGLMPSHFQSGPMCRDQGISKAGNTKARTTMVELAWMWLQHQPGSPLSAWFHSRVGKLKGRIRRITNRRNRPQATVRTLAPSRDRSRA